jgi:hypothetical protein
LSLTVFDLESLFVTQRRRDAKGGRLAESWGGGNAIEQAIERLPSSELRQLDRWITERDAEIARDPAAGDTGQTITVCLETFEIPRSSGFLVSLTPVAGAHLGSGRQGF